MSASAMEEPLCPAPRVVFSMATTWRIAVTLDRTTRRYVADVVGLPVHAQGLTEKEAVRHAREAIAVHLKALESLAVGRGANTRIVMVKA